MNKKRLPSKTSNFADLIESGMYYVDKTHFIKQLEEMSDKYLFFLRPRRFGKSLTLSMLEYYYGVEYSHKFEQLFGEYYIGKKENVTLLKNSYHILRFDFSGISTENPFQIKRSFLTKVATGFRFFNRSYNLIDNKVLSELENETEPSDYLSKMLNEVISSNKDIKIFILIDEYDHFTNELFSFNTSHFKEIVSGNGWVRKFFEVIKQFMGKGMIDRFFATGVTPVTLDGMTSGFNVAKNISLSPAFNSMAGFTDEELQGMIYATLDETKDYDYQGLKTDLSEWYNGSRFAADATERLYNPQLVISFLSDFMVNYKSPQQMVDVNVTSDYKKIASVLNFLPEETADSIIGEVLNEGAISESLTIQYNFELPFGKSEAVSLLFYNGLLTIDSVKFNYYRFVVPNYVVRILYWEYFRYINETRKKIRYDNSRVNESIIELSETGSVTRLAEYVKTILMQLSNRDIINFDEKSLKMIFMTLLMSSNAYMVKSETETASGYADLILKRTRINPGGHDFLIELKYVKQKDLKKLQEVREAGLEQLKNYKSSLSDQERDAIKAYLVIFYNKYEFEVSEVS